MTNFSSLARAQRAPRFLAVLGLLATAGAAQAQSFAPAVTYTTGGTMPYYVVTGDLNGDGRPDLVTANLNGQEASSPPGSVGVLLGQAGGTFAAAVAYASGGNSTYGLAVADVNGDGKADVVTANEYSNNVSVLLGTGTGALGPAVTFPTGTSTNPFGVAVGDVNGDGQLDIVVVNTYFTTRGNSTVGVLLGTGTGTFGAITAYPLGTGNGGRGVTLADLNRDRRLDIVVTDVNTNGLRVLLGQAAGGFSAAATYTIGGSYPFFAAVADLNQDGNPDLVSAGGGGVSFLPGTGTGTFGTAVTNKSVSDNIAGFTLGDVTGDGQPDALVANRDLSTIGVLAGTGAGAFSNMVTYPSGGSSDGSFSLTLGDFNRDGKADIAVSNTTNSRLGVLLNTATYAAPTLTNLNPTSGPVGTSVTLTGTNLGSATGVSFNGTAATAFTVVNATTLTATVPAGATTGNVTVTTGGGVSNGVLFTVAYPDLVVTTTTPIAAGTYNSITVSSPGVGTLAGNVTVNTSTTVNDGATLNDGCFVLSGAGSFMLAAGGTLGICAAQGISSSGATGAVQVTGTRSFSPDASYVYNGTAAQSTGSGLPTQVRSLRIANSSNVTLSAPSSFTQVLALNSTGNLVLAGNALTLLSSASGTALVVNAGTGSITGSFQAQRYLDGSLNAGLGYRQFGAPVSGATVGSLTATAGFTPVLTPGYNGSATPGTTRPFPNVFAYDETRLATATNNLSAFDKGFVVPAATTTALAPGQGYDVNIAAGQTVTFAGSAFSGDLTKSLSRGTDASAGWALLGNPYPAPLDYSLLAPADRPGLDAAIYVVQSSGQYTSSYRSYINNVGNPVLPLGQGFFTRVSVGQASGTLTFRNSQRKTVVDNTAFQRTAADPRPLVQLDLAGQGLADAFIAYAEAGATPAFDREFDAAKLPNPSGLNLSSATATDNLAIDGRPAFTAATALPLVVGVPAAGTYTLSAAALNNLPAGLDAYLRDAATGQTVKLRVGAPYSFSVTAAQATAVLVGRFTLQFSVVAPLATAASLSAADVTVYPNPAHARFTVLVPAVAAAPAVQAELLNTLGQVVRQQAAALPAAGATLTVETAGLAAGIYTLRLHAGATTLAKRVVIQ